MQTDSTFHGIKLTVGLPYLQCVIYNNFSVREKKKERHRQRQTETGRQERMRMRDKKRQKETERYNILI